MNHFQPDSVSGLKVPGNKKSLFVTIMLSQNRPSLFNSFEGRKRGRRLGVGLGISYLKLSSYSSTVARGKHYQDFVF